MTRERRPRLLHAVVGHRLPIYFVNALCSVMRCAPDDDLLVVDNASGLPELDVRLKELAATHRRARIVRRTVNDLARNGKVGGLYDAYRDVVAHALEGGYELLHIMQADMQMLYWDEELVDRALQIYMRFPTCVNIHLTALPSDRRLSAGEVSVLDGPLIELVRYGLTDTGLYHLGRWREREIQFTDSERDHARLYASRGLRVLCHPWPAVAQVPWPAVVRRGRVIGREVDPVKELLLRPLSDAEISRLRMVNEPVWLEDVCTPWGWTCLSPMWPTGLESLDYWVFRYRDARARGWRRARPRWERRGLGDEHRWRPQRRPSLWRLLTAPLWYEARRRLRLGRNTGRWLGRAAAGAPGATEAGW